MLIRSKQHNSIKSYEITPERVYHSRRQFIKSMGTGAIGAGVLGCDSASGQTSEIEAESTAKSTQDITPKSVATSYNNFYEFGTGKEDPSTNAHSLTTSPWTVKVSGKAKKTGTYNLEDILRPHTAEERIYRLRCVEAWSMVIPWLGIPLADVLKRFEPASDAKYVEFTTLKRPSEMPGQRSIFTGMDWPYVEGLRLDEAYNPLTLLAVGMYGEELPNQNGAPLRLVVPWKYGFKSIKSIVKIRFTNRMPKTTWNLLNANEYGFYSNVNPEVSHPRWSQATERRLPNSLFDQNRIPTEKFNGYAEQVASMYAGMDLKRNF